MSLRQALAQLPDDRETLFAAREVVAFLIRHPGEAFDAARVTRSVGVDGPRAEAVLEALATTFVVDCDGEPHFREYRYSPDSVLDLEMRRFLRTSSGAQANLRRQTDRFRDRYGSGR